MTLEQIFLRLTDAADKGTQLLATKGSEKAKDEEAEEVVETKTKKSAPKVKIDLESGEATVGEETGAEEEYSKEDN